MMIRKLGKILLVTGGKVGSTSIEGIQAWAIGIRIEYKIKLNPSENLIFENLYVKWENAKS